MTIHTASESRTREYTEEQLTAAGWTSPRLRQRHEREARVSTTKGGVVRQGLLRILLAVCLALGVSALYASTAEAATQCKTTSAVSVYSGSNYRLTMSVYFCYDGSRIVGTPSISSSHSVRSAVWYLWTNGTTTGWWVNANHYGRYSFVNATVNTLDGKTYHPWIQILTNGNGAWTWWGAA